MSDKVTQILERIAGYPVGIADVARSGNELFFKFKGHTFSILSRTDEDPRYGRYSFYVYPSWGATCQELASAFDTSTAEDIDMVAYHSRASDDKPFGDVYTAVEGAYFHVDAIFDDILNDN
jgi:hypothetical protein